MAIIFADGMDSYTATADITTKFDNNSDLTDNTFSSTGGRFGGGVIVCSDDGQWVDKIIPASGTAVTTDELFVSFSYKISNLTLNSSHGVWGFSQNGEVGAITPTVLDGLHCRINGSQIQLMRGTALIATGTFTFVADTWYRIQVRLVIDPSSGIFQIKVNDTLDIDFSGDTDDAGPHSVNVIKLGHQSTTGASYYDDIVIHNSAGSSPTSWLGDLRIETLRPDGAGDSSDSTPSTGTRHEAVDDSGVNDGDTTYVAMGLNDEDLYTASNLSFTPTTIHSVVTNVVCRADGTTPRKIRGKVKTSSTEGNGTAKDVFFGSVYRTVQDSFPTDPTTATAWTETGVNGMQIGQEVTV